jgi:uncharacterized membrane protein YhaH (DUF805 family)
MNLQTFISFDGRIPRKTFWLAFLVMLIISWILQLIIFSVFGVSMMTDPNATPEMAMQQMSGMMLPLGIVVLLTIWPSLAIYTKRWHDRNKSGWWSLIGFVPIIGGIWMLVELGFLRGTEGANRFGPDPIAD